MSTDSHLGETLDAVRSVWFVNARSARTLAWALAALLLTIGGWASLQPWGLHWDFANFYDAGHRFINGQSDRLYDATSPIVGEDPVGVMRFWGAPLAAVIYAPLALTSPEVALRLFKLENLGAYIIALWLFATAYLKPLDTAPSSERDRRLVGLLALCLVFQPFWTVFLVGGQTTPTVFLLLVVFLVFYVRGSVWGPAFALSLVGIIKPAFITMAPIFLLLGQFRLLSALLLIMVAEGLISLGVLGWPAHLAFASQLTASFGFQRLWQYNSSLAAFVRNFTLLWSGHPPPQIAALLDWTVLLVKLAVVIFFAAFAWEARRRPMTSAGRRNLAALLSLWFFLLVSEILWEHYVAVLFIPATYVLARQAYFTDRAVKLMGAALALSVGQNIWLMLTVDRLIRIDTVSEVLLIGLFKSGPVLLAAVFLLFYHEALLRSHIELTLSEPVEPPAPRAC